MTCGSPRLGAGSNCKLENKTLTLYTHIFMLRRYTNLRLNYFLESIYLQGIFKCVVQFHNGRLVAATVAIVGRAEYSHDVTIVTPVVAFHDQLMGPGDQSQPVRVIEGLRDVLAERVTGTPGRDAPSSAIVRI